MFRSSELVVYFYICLYFLSIGLILSASSSFVVWCLMEFSMLLFIASSWGLSQSIFSLIGYFLVQALGSLMFLLPVFSTYLGFPYELTILLIFVPISIKLGLFPFFSWYLPALLVIPYSVLFLAISFQKLPSLSITISLLQNLNYSTISLQTHSFVYSFLLLSVLIASFGSIIIIDLRSLYIISSLTGGVWIYLVSTISITLMLFYLVLYSISLYYLMGLAESSVVFTSWFQSGIFLCFIGFPPFPIFIVNLVAVFSLLSLGSSSLNLIVSLLVGATIVSMLFYLRQFLFLNSLNYSSSYLV